MKRLLLATILAAGVWPVAARAAPYWVAWEGNDYPENEGWERIHYREDGPTAIRSLSNGVMTLDGLESIEIIDAYRMNRALDPEPGEEFVAQWGLRANEVNGNPIFQYDPGFALTSDDGWRVSVVIGEDAFYSILEHATVEIASVDFLNWEFRTSDMQSYTLSINGAVVFAGDFVQTGARQPRIDWGDYVAGSTSTTDWDYFRFGVVPEPSSGTIIFAMLGVSCVFTSRRIS